MLTVSIGELRKNPQAVLRQVLMAKEPVSITHRGQETGVALQAQTQIIPQRFLSGSVLNKIFAASPLTEEQAQSWIADIYG